MYLHYARKFQWWFESLRRDIGDLLPNLLNLILHGVRPQKLSPTYFMESGATPNEVKEDHSILKMMGGSKGNIHEAIALYGISWEALCRFQWGSEKLSSLLGSDAPPASELQS